MSVAMARGKTVHVVPRDGGWLVRRDANSKAGTYRTQKEAIKGAREIARSAESGQVVIHGRDGRIREHDTYGMPKIQDPPGKKSSAIEKAVSKVTRDRFGIDSHPRGQSA